MGQIRKSKMEASIPPKSAITSTVSNLKYSYQQTGKTQNKTKADCALSRRTRLKQEGGGAQRRRARS